MTGPLYRLARLCVRRGRWTILFWVVIAVVLAFLAKSIGEDTNDDLTLPGSDSTAAQDLLQSEFPKQQYGSVPIVLAVDHGKLTDPANRKVVDATVKSLKAEDHVTSAISPFSKQGKQQLSKEKQIAYISLTLNQGPTDLDADEANAILDAASPAKKAGMQVAVGAYVGQELSKTTDSKSDAIGLLAAMVILLFAFGTVVAMGLPIATALLGLVSALSILALLSHVFNVPTVGPTLATMIGLGVGIDYALFIVTRHKDQLGEGMDPRESAARAAATAGGAVVFAGSTVVIALCSLVLANIPIVTSLGFSAAIGVVVAVLAAVTLMPALLGRIGMRINSLKVPVRNHAKDDHPHGWVRYADWIARRPWRALLASLVVLLLLAFPTRLLHLGSTDTGQLPTDTTARQAYDLLSKGFQPGVNGPFLIAVDLQKKAAPNQKDLNKISKQEKKLDQQQQQLNEQLAQAKAQAHASEQQAIAAGLPPDQAKQQADAQLAPVSKQVNQGLAKIKKSKQQLAAQKKLVNQPATDPRLQKFRNQLQKSPGIVSVTQPLVNKQDNAVVYTAIPSTSPSNTKTEDLIRTLRQTTIPQATQGQQMTAYVGGTTAAYVDLADRITDRLILVIGIVIGLSFLLLMLAFRSIVVPLKAGLMNLISVGAAYGVITFVFQEGHGIKLIGLDHSVPIVSFVPLLMFAILFGLSMDYEVFLISRIQEQYRASNDNHDSVVYGIAHTGKVITSAALIMVCVFASFLFNGDPTVKQFGLGLAVAIAVDSTIVRCLLVPSAMVLMKTGNWWFPNWLDRIMPNLGIEGDEYFAERDAAVAGALREEMELEEVEAEDEAKPEEPPAAPEPPSAAPTPAQADGHPDPDGTPEDPEPQTTPGETT